ncbi:hypothetical protein T439DRAFT_382165 [Meredithblackwellia eburnea MCA 4105]
MTEEFARHDPGTLVVELTAKLDQQLRANNCEDLTVQLQRQLAALLRPSTSASSGNSSASNPSSPISPPQLGTSPTFSTALQGDPNNILSEALVAALQRERGLVRENSDLRAAYREASANQRALEEELSGLRRRYGISLEELADLEGSTTDFYDQSNFASGSSSQNIPRHRNSRSKMSSSSYSPSSSSILIPGTSEPSSFARRSRTSSYSSRGGGGSSIRTTLTTPSTSYPVTGVPNPTPTSSSPRGGMPSPSALFRAFPAAMFNTDQTASFSRGPAPLTDDDLLSHSPPEEEDRIDDTSGGETPLSTSPGSVSRSSLSRRASVATRQ